MSRFLIFLPLLTLFACNTEDNEPKPNEPSTNLQIELADTTWEKIEIYY